MDIPLSPAFFCFLFLITAVRTEYAESQGKYDEPSSIWDYFDFADFSWLKRLVEIIFGNYIIPDTDIPDLNSRFFLLTTTKTPFEATLQPWIRNITSTRAYTKVTPQQLWTRRSYSYVTRTARTFPTTTTAPFKTTESFQQSLLLKKLTSNLSERPNEIVFLTTPRSTVSNNNISQKNSCEQCQPGKECSICYKSFETSDAAFHYAYNHSSAPSEMLKTAFQVCANVVESSPRRR
ncbi:hypothetical protein L596_003947 [Steinernema carpocapsae]|uniref:C2H2-type domain-containing protein n=1 Tax=Steinernema carpocapsae TaxID=34508 RepID=A0A4U8UUB2_STECR|nr:hypothetical protein L596_003947 [Steinernema carpocapsae]